MATEKEKLTGEQLAELFEREFGGVNSLQELADRLEKLTGPHKDALRNTVCDELLYRISMGYTRYEGAFPGFWAAMEKILRQYPHREGIPELCGLIGTYYSCESHEETPERLFAFSERFPALILPRELMALTYCDMKYWKNALAVFEELEDKAVFLRGEQLHFRMAWCYGMAKEWEQEKDCYRKVLETEPEHTEARGTSM